VPFEYASTAVQSKAGPPPPQGIYIALNSAPAGFVRGSDPNIEDAVPDPSLWSPSLTYAINEADYEIPNKVDSQPPEPNPSCVGNPVGAPSADREYVRGIIRDQYCPFLATGAINGGAVSIDRATPYAPVGYPAGDVGTPQAANDLWLSISLDPSLECALGFQADLDICEDMLNRALDGCNTDSTSAKYGGSVDYLCGIYDMQLKPGHDGIPPRGFAAEMGPA
jgi:hypothetical protein